MSYGLLFLYSQCDCEDPLCGLSRLLGKLSHIFLFAWIDSNVSEWVSEWVNMCAASFVSIISIPCHSTRIDGGWRKKFVVARFYLSIGFMYVCVSNWNFICTFSTMQHSFSSLLFFCSLTPPLLLFFLLVDLFFFFSLSRSLLVCCNF